MIGEPAILSAQLNKNLYLTLLVAITIFTFVSPMTGYTQTLQDEGPTVQNSDMDRQGDSSENKLGTHSDVIDTDGDGLPDFQEINKYLTDPAKKDTDGDGVPDGDWNERREYTYSIRSILQFMPPFDKAALNDDFQDARVLEERADYIKLEVIHYPFSTTSKSVDSNPDWQRDYALMTEYLRPDVTTNWDAKMRQDLLAELQADGILIDKLSDKQVVEQVSSWLMKKSKSFNDIFTTYYVHFPNGRPNIYPGLEDAFSRHKGKHGWTEQQQFEHELLGKGMFYNKTHGSCTSYAVYLTTVLRAVGIPTRMIIVIPLIDPSNKDQLLLVQERISHNEVRERILAKLRDSSRGFVAHTFNEVYVGNRWRRFNYNEFVQSDRRPFGLPTHLYTFKDLSEANLAPTWGRRYGKSEKTAIFKHDNPYSTIELSDLFGRHSNIPNPVAHVKEHKQLTITKAYWFHSSERPRRIPGDAVPKDHDGHILLHIDEWFEGEGTVQYKSFYNMADKHFLLKAQGHPDVQAKAERGYWDQEFYIRIHEEEFVKMEIGVLYTIHPVNSHPKYQWKVSHEVAIRKSDEFNRQILPAPLPNIYIMSPSGFNMYPEIFEMVRDVTFNKTGRPHDRKSYDSIFIESVWGRKPGDILVLLFSLETDDRVPAEYEDILPVAWSGIKSALKQGKSLELKSDARKMNIIVLAAPTTEKLGQLVRKSSLLKAIGGKDKKPDAPLPGEKWTRTGRTKGPAAYTVTITEGNWRKAVVNCRIVTDGDLSLWMNNNGAPQVPNGHASFVRNLKAVDSAGKKVPIKDYGQARWKMPPVDNQPVTLSYEVLLEHDKSDLPWGPDEAPYVTEDGAFWTGRALFIVAEMNNVTLRFDLPDRWHVSTPWQPAPGEVSAFSLKNADELTEAFIFAGTHIEERARVGDMEITLALGTKLEPSKELLKTASQKLLNCCVELFGGTVPGRTLIVINRQEREHSFDGGVFGRSVSMLLGDEPKKENIEQWAPFIAHEVLHLWNGQVIGHEGHENWFSEGFTDYYAMVVCARIGLIDEHQFIQRLQRAAERYFTKSSQKSIREARGYELQYAGGSLAGASLDIIIRNSTNNTKSLDDLMRQMYQEFGKTGKKYSLEQVIRITNSIARTDNTDFFEKYVDGTDELPLEEYFGYMGLDLQKQIIDALPDGNYVIHKMLHIMSLRQTQNTLLIRRSQEAGYKDDDLLTAIDGTPVGSFRDIQTVAKRLKPGDKIEIALLRAGKKVTLELDVGGEGQRIPLERKVEVTINKKARLNSSQKAILSGITGKQ